VKKEPFMKKLPFKSSQPLSLGVELELQIVDARSFGLIARAKDLLRIIKQSSYQKEIKPEVTQSMIEINSGIHRYAADLYSEFQNIHDYLLELSQEMQIHFSGGGTHPFQKWSALKIFPTSRFKKLSQQYRYLSKTSTVFGEHIHVGCPSAEDALYLSHAFIRYLPQLMALSASSPFYQGIDTGYQSTRSLIFNVYPSSGVMPYLLTWQEFSDYFYKMRDLKILESMKDLYWDVRPKPEFGTVEIRVCDTPLTINKSIQIAAYAQALAAYLLEKRPVTVSQNLYQFYPHNRFQGIRYGFDGQTIDADTFKSRCIQEDILQTFDSISPYISQLNSTEILQELHHDVENKMNDATLLRKLYKQMVSLQQLVEQQCKLWINE